MSKAKFIAFDTETGGLDPKIHPILTAYFLVLDEELNPIDSLDIKIKPEAPYTELTDGAMKINMIDMKAHLASPDILTRQQAGEKIKEFMKKHKSFKEKEDAKKALLEPMGHNVAFDINMIQEQLILEKEYRQHFHYRTVDTSPITNFLKSCELLPAQLGNLSSIGAHFDFKTDGAHDAKFDVHLCVNIYKKMVGLVKSLKNSSGNSSKSILELIEQ